MSASQGQLRHAQQRLPARALQLPAAGGGWARRATAGARTEGEVPDADVVEDVLERVPGLVDEPIVRDLVCFYSPRRGGAGVVPAPESEEVNGRDEGEGGGERGGGKGERVAVGRERSAPRGSLTAGRP